jgi:hypothetical protein
VRSGYPPERLEIELQSRLGPSLAAKGYCVVGHGPTGVTWRRELPGRLSAGLLFLGLFALGLFGAATVGSVLLGLICIAVGSVVLYIRRPATVTIGLTRVPGGTEISVSEGPDARSVKDFLHTLASSSRAVAPAPNPPLAPSVCETCGQQVAGNFCANCGKSRTLTCSGCGQVGLMSEFCPSCGSATYEPPVA